MITYTKEQEEDIGNRATQADKEIKDILDKYELVVKALPAFTEIEGGRCVAVGIIQYNDIKYTKTPTIETEETPSENLPVEDAA